MPSWVALFVASFVMICVCIAAMSIGYVLRRKPIAGSCGGIAAYRRMQGESHSASVQCSHCGRELSSDVVECSDGA